MLDPSTTIRASASVECNWSSTNEEVNAQLRAVTPETTVRIRTARLRLASLPLALGFAIGLGGLGIAGDAVGLAVDPSLDCPESSVEGLG
jgi:hypothetical protein